MRIGDVIDLAQSPNSDGGHVIETVYAWYRERTMTVVKATAGAGASLLLTLLLSFFKKELQVTWWGIAVVLAGSASAIAYGIWRFHELQSVNDEYFAAIKLHDRLSRVYRLHS